MKVKSVQEHPRNQIYARILSGKSYKDITSSLCTYQTKKMLDSINRYRPYEGIDMTSVHKAKVSGLPKTTCAQLNLIYRNTRGDRS